MKATCLQAATVAILVLGLSAQAAATPLSLEIGLFSYDVQLDAFGNPVLDADGIAVTSFNVENLLDPGSQPDPSFEPSLLSFSTLALTLDGAPQTLISTTVSPGPIVPILLVAGAQTYTSALLAGELSTVGFYLTDGRFFTANTSAFNTEILNFGAGAVVVITLSGDVDGHVNVPEPATCLFVASGGAVLFSARRLFGRRR